MTEIVQFYQHKHKQHKASSKFAHYILSWHSTFLTPSDISSMQIPDIYSSPKETLTK